jgi:hypothetical protein
MLLVLEKRGWLSSLTLLLSAKLLLLLFSMMLQWTNFLSGLFPAC